jgi:cellulose synthase/poly-beta-1,6-N-acetylglucosamine synthase-like glycosyltransferase
MLAFLFLLSIGGIAFTYFGYPLLIAAWAYFAPRLVRYEPFEPAVTIVIVGHNEARSIAAKIDSCLAQDYPADKLQVLIASDGSTDDMLQVIAAYGNPRVRSIAFGERRGKAACLNDAVAACDDEVLVFCDVRQQLDANAVRCLVENLSDDSVGAVSGELAFVADSATGFGEGVDAYWRYEKFIRQCEGAIASVVGVTGALYALRRSLWQPIPAHTILDDVMIPMNVVMQGKRVLFEKRALAWDRPSTSPQRERVRKVRTLAGNFQLLALRPDFLLPWRNPLFFQLFCHKVLRLAVPLFMLTAFASNVLLAARTPTWALLMAVQLAGYGLAFVGTAHAPLARWKAVRLLSTFVLMNGFVVLGFLDFLGNKNAHLWRTERSTQ